MRCPKCSLVTSNKRDLCPRCEFDLRPKKKELGIASTNATAPYSALLQELRSQPASTPNPTPTAAESASNTSAKTEPSGQTKSKGSLWSKLLGSKSKNEPQAPATSTEKSSADSAPLTPTPQASPSSPTVPSPQEQNQASPQNSPQHSPHNSAKTSNQGTTTSSTAAPTVLGSRALASGKPPPVVQTDLNDLIAALDLLASDSPTTNINQPVEKPEEVRAATQSKPAFDTSLSLTSSNGTESDISLLLDQMAAEPLVQVADSFSAPHFEELPDLGFAGTEMNQLEEPLFSVQQSIDEDQLTDLLHSLENLEETAEEPSEIDSISLFTDLVGSAEDSLEEARSATESLSLHDLVGIDPLEVLEDLFPNDPEINESAPETTPFETKSPSAQSSSQPYVAPTVVEFNDDDDDEGLEAQIEELFGSMSLDVEAVKVEKKSVPAKGEKSPTGGVFTTEDGLEIEFEFGEEAEIEDLEVEQSPAAATLTESATDLSDEENTEEDTLLAGLVSSYEALEAQTQSLSIDSVPKASSEKLSTEKLSTEHPSTGKGAAITSAESSPSKVNRSQQELTAIQSRYLSLMQQLSSLPSELQCEISSLFDELVGLPFVEPPQSESESPRKLDELGQEQPQALINAELSSIAESSEELDLSIQELEIALDGLEEEPTVAEIKTQPEVSAEELAGLEAELASELALLEQDGVTLYAAEESDQSTDEITDEITEESVNERRDETLDLQTEPEVLASPEQALEVELESELDLVAADSESATDEISADELAGLEAELASELALLEQDGVTLYAAEESDQSTDEITDEIIHESIDESLDLQTQPEILAAPEQALEVELESELDLVAANSESATDEISTEELAGLEAELASELALLEQDGVTLYAAEESDQSTDEITDEIANEIPDESTNESIDESLDLQTQPEILAAPELALEVELESELESVAANSESATDEISADELAGLEAELASELALLEQDGTTLHAGAEELARVDAESSLLADVKAEETGAELDSSELKSSELKSSELESSEAIFYSDDLVELDAEASALAACNETPLSDDHQEIDLDSLADVFLGAGAAEFEGQILNDHNSSSVKFQPETTSRFLASDLEKIIAESSPSGALIEVPQIDEVLWTDCKTELNTNSEIELSASTLCELRQDEQAIVLFDVVAEDLRSPEKQSSRVTEIDLGATRTVENLSLKQALNTFVKEEQIVEKVRSERKALNQIGLVEEIAKTAVELPPVALFRRLAAMAIDCLCIALIGGFISWLYILSPATKLALAAFTLPTMVDLTAAVCPTLMAIYLSWIGYSTLLVASSGQTTGDRVMGFGVYDRFGYSPGIKQSLLRALAQTTVLLTFGLGLLPLLRTNGSALHDQIAKTQLSAKRD